MKKILKKGKPLHFNLENEERKVVDVLKKLIAPLVLALSRIYDKYTIETEVLEIQVGCELLKSRRSRFWRLSAIDLACCAMRR